MKSLFTLLFLLPTATICFASPYEHLCKVNKLWSEQRDIDAHAIYLSPKPNTYGDWIRVHLELVEKILRNRNPAHLSESQRENRICCLDYLNEYWVAGSFPQNEDYSFLTPIFIDKHNTFCAVGYLLKSSGYESLARKISATNNLIYVREIADPALLTWATDNGFTVDELAWIQPDYEPDFHLNAIGGGTNGTIRSMLADSVANRLYIGGDFTKVDGSIPSSGISYITEDASFHFTWHDISGNLSGSVSALTRHNNFLVAAGDFTLTSTNVGFNVAKWDGVSWSGMSCLTSGIEDMIVYHNNLYAAGHFANCISPDEITFAKWTGTDWQPISGLSGRINTLQVVDSSLFLGGMFKYGGDSVNMIRWSDQTGFHLFGTTTAHEVMDFESYRDTVYAVCRRTSLDSNLLLRLFNNSWISHLTFFYNQPQVYWNGNVKSFNALCKLGDTLMMAGEYYFNNWCQFLKNSADISNNVQNYYCNRFTTNGPINKMVIFRNKFIVAGNFTGNLYGYGNLNGLGYRASYLNTNIASEPNTIPGLQVFPNPAIDRNIIVENNFKAQNLQLLDMTGKVIFTYTMSPTSSSQNIALPELSQGTYVLEVWDAAGKKAITKLSIF